MDFKAFANYLTDSLITPLFGIFFGAAIVFFLWNVMGAIKNSSQPEEREKFRAKAVWGVIAIAVMVSVFGLVGFITGSLHLTNAPLDLQRFDKPLGTP